MDDKLHNIDLIEKLQASGRYTFTISEAKASMAKTEIAVENILRRQKKHGRIIAPRRGFYVIVPIEYRSAGAPPPSWYIDELMRFIGQPYYVGLLSAAALYEASHQQPMSFQVITDRSTRTAIAGRTRIEFFKSCLVRDAVTADIQTETGSMQVSSPEVTALDLIRFSYACGGWSNVTTVIGELADRIDPDRLQQAAQQRKTSEVQRLGYLLDLAARPRLADGLLRVITTRRFRPVQLAPEAPRGSEMAVDPWRVIPNEAVEPDL